MYGGSRRRRKVSDVLESKNEATFEESLEKLETIVDQLESGDVPLETAIQLFQDGMQLSKTCHEKLQKVEKQIHLLMEEEGELIEKDFNLEEDPS